MQEDDRLIALCVTCAAFIAAIALMALTGDRANEAGGVNEGVLRFIQWGVVPLFFGGMMYWAWEPVQRDR